MELIHLSHSTRFPTLFDTFFFVLKASTANVSKCSVIRWNLRCNKKSVEMFWWERVFGIMLPLNMKTMILSEKTFVVWCTFMLVSVCKLIFFSVLEWFSCKILYKLIFFCTTIPLVYLGCFYHVYIHVLASYLACMYLNDVKYGV